METPPASVPVAPANETRAVARASAPADANVPDVPVVIPAGVHGINPALISRNAVRVTQGLQEAGFRAFIVGGAVRDLLLGVAPKDFDVATDATPDQVQRLFRRARIIGRRFQIVHVQFGQEIIEVSTFRALVDPVAEAATAAANAVQAAVDADGAERTATRLATQAADIGTNATAAAYVSAPLEADLLAADQDDDATDDANETRGNDARAGERPGGGTHHRGERDRGDRGRRRRREDPDRRLHAVDASGRVLRDNVWGEQHEDARRRDFTINAMYYDPASQTVLDYHQGMADMRARLLRMIGDPATRYREDPVRMLRVVRFAGKLDFEIEAATREPIASLAELINNVPAARVFDEILKLLLSGNALACLTRLRAEGLHRDLLPLLDVALEQAHSEKFITLSLTNTDARVRAGKTVSPGFLFAALLWHQTQQRWQRYVAEGEYPIPALHRAMDEVLDAQTGKLAIQRRFVSDMKEIWGMQPRLEKRAGRSALKLLEHPRFRAAYDFLLLRCESGEMDPTLGAWWTDFIEGDPGAREVLLSGGPRDAKAKPRRRRRGGRGGAGAAGSGENAGAPSAAPRPGAAFEDD
ncbi:polynucleotide adenylyltransferase PcnB [Robbsia sp. Bb-Pol-6]|uniref:Poly(A) polymerase I n=1 Tax=Robbsia betulipollinis TaxID=2981849 RepID=A0ABT3ZQX2_9BURK|nr:polynucleotide adenylyltransferase PcnB [Robbsia betulipollinis]MCY0388822.1 polynucleotide adenylyltransferase PcnB [Robbsia betulipollinis]